MKRTTTDVLTILGLIFFLSPHLLSQDPDGWEDYQTSLQPPHIVLEAIDLKEGMVVGEIGAGRGRYTVILAEEVGADGHIYANDIDKQSLQYLESRCKRDHITNITTILGQASNPLLPDNQLDMIFMVNVYHHIRHPVEVLKNAYPALKSKGTLVIIEGVPDRKVGNRSHATPKKEILSQVEKAGYRFVRVAAELQRDNIYIFRKE
jgi:ubiquinone/menaquinone biosynthesis C-methylase UbiE